MKVNAIIEKTPDGMYSVFVTDDIPGFGISGYGVSVEDAKRDLEVSVAELREVAVEMGRKFPDNLEFEFSYDTASFASF